MKKCLYFGQSIFNKFQDGGVGLVCKQDRTEFDKVGRYLGMPQLTFLRDIRQLPTAFQATHKANVGIVSKRRALKMKSTNPNPAPALSTFE